MQRSLAPVLTVLLLAAAIPAGSAPAAADGLVSVSTTVAPSQPVPEEEFTITANLSSTEDSSSTYKFLEAEVREGREKGDELVSRTELTGELRPGTTRELAVDAQLNESGTHTVFLHVEARDTDGDRRRIVQPVTVDVIQGHPQVAVDTDPAAPGEPRTMRVTLSNGLDTSVSNVELVAASDAADVSESRRVAATLATGGEQTFEYTVRPEENAVLPVDVRVRYTTDGERRDVEYTLDADFSPADEPSEHPQLEVNVPTALPESSRPVNVTVANGLDEDVRQVSVTVSSDQATFDTTERVRATMTAGQTASFSFPATVDEAGRYPVTVTLRYTDENGRQQVSRTFQANFDEPTNPGRVTLTGVDAVARGGTLELSATASNVGSDDVSSVVVSIPGSGPATGTDYFVGSVDASDFASFTLSTGVTGNLSSVPVEVTYTVDGVERSFTTEVPVTQVDTQPRRAGGGGSDLPIVPIAVGAVVVILLIVAARIRG